MVNPSLPVHSVPEFIAYAKTNPGRIAVGSYQVPTPASDAIEAVYKKLNEAEAAKRDPSVLRLRQEPSRQPFVNRADGSRPVLPRSGKTQQPPGRNQPRAPGG